MLRTMGKKITNQSDKIFLQKFSSAASSKYLEVTKNEKNGISTVSMARSPVNGLHLPMLTELKDAFSDVQKNGSRGMILTSSLPTIFSAGLDIMEMYKPESTRVTNFWRSLQDAWLALYGLRVPTAAAINGSSPAGGCLLAMSCEYRVMVESEHTIGLNETQLGIVAPQWFMNTMIDTIGYRQAELALLKGKLFTPQEALKIGLVDELVANKEAAISKCEEYIQSFARISERGRAATKINLRNERIAWLKNNREQDTEKFIQFVKDPEVQKGLDLYIQSLKKRKSNL